MPVADVSRSGAKLPKEGAGLLGRLRFQIFGG